MKKILTLILAVAAVGTVQAQTSRDEARKVILGQPKGGSTSGGGGTSTQGRDVILGGGNGGGNTGQYPNYPNSGTSVDQINREYDQKIWSIRNNPNLSQAEKERIIRQLEQDRARRIRQVTQSGENRNYKKNKDYKKDRDDDDDDDRYEGRKDNGKHKGWYKGKGNQRKGKG
jgi:hypothetical protein